MVHHRLLADDFVVDYQRVHEVVGEVVEADVR